MVPSDDGDHPMTRLSDTQLVILSAAAQRDDLAVLPLPDRLTLKGGALNKVIGQPPQPGPDPACIRRDDRPERLVLTREGMAAIGVERTTTRRWRPADTGPTSTEADSAAAARRPGADRAGSGPPSRRRAAKRRREGHQTEGGRAAKRR